MSAAHGGGDDVDEGALGRVIADAPAQGDIDDAGARHFNRTQVTAAPVELLDGLGVGALAGQTEGVGHGAVGGQEIDEVRGAALGAEDFGALGGAFSQDRSLQQVSRGLSGALRRSAHRQVIGGLRARRRGVLGARGLLGTALISQGQGQPGHEEARLAQAGAQRRSVVFGRRWKDLRISPVAHASAGDAALDLADHAQLGSLGVLLEGRGEARPARRIGEDPGYAATETHGVGLAPAVHLDVHAGAQRVDNARAHTVEASGRTVGPSPELPPGVELGVDELHAGQPGGRLNVNGHTAAGVPHLNGTVGMDNNIDTVPMAFQRLIDAVVHDLPDAVHQTPLVGRADVHAGTLAHRLQSLQYGEVASGVVAAGGLVLRRGHGRTVTDHGRTGVPPRRDRTCGLRQPPPASAVSGTRTASGPSSRVLEFSSSRVPEVFGSSQFSAAIRNDPAHGQSRTDTGAADAPIRLSQAEAHLALQDGAGHGPAFDKRLTGEEREGPYAAEVTIRNDAAGRLKQTRTPQLTNHEPSGVKTIDLEVLALRGADRLVASSGDTALGDSGDVQPPAIQLQCSARQVRSRPQCGIDEVLPESGVLPLPNLTRQSPARVKSIRHRHHQQAVLHFLGEAVAAEALTKPVDRLARPRPLLLTHAGGDNLDRRGQPDLIQQASQRAVGHPTRMLQAVHLPIVYGAPLAASGVFSVLSVLRVLSDPDAFDVLDAFDALDALNALALGARHNDTLWRDGRDRPEHRPSCSRSSRPAWIDGATRPLRMFPDAPWAKARAPGAETSSSE